ncbi:uncharacterized protein LOC135385452 isoform X2 [Ornithodoros turicata]|uniref:uncharacterized protein LOC135385452 isoform X2 n=1 Tax=Ornithodoros turicata TaxID=34597 RepID=UPI003139DD3D
MTTQITVKDFPELSNINVSLVLDEDDVPQEICAGCSSIMPLLYKVSGCRYLCEECLNNDAELLKGRKKITPLKWKVEWDDIEYLEAQCPNEVCEKHVQLCRMQEHLTQCVFRPTDCTLSPEDVAALLPINNIRLHCAKTAVTCSQAMLVEKTKGVNSRKKKKTVTKANDREDEIESLKRMVLELSAKLSAVEAEQKKQRCLVSAAIKRPPFSYIWSMKSFKKFKEEALKSTEGSVSQPFFFGVPGCKFRLQGRLSQTTHDNQTVTCLGVFVQLKVTDQDRFSKVYHPKMKCTVEIASHSHAADTLVFPFMFSADGSDDRQTPGRARYMWNTLFSKRKFVTLADLENEELGYVQDDILLIEFYVRD